MQESTLQQHTAPEEVRLHQLRNHKIPVTEPRLWEGLSEGCSLEEIILGLTLHLSTPPRASRPRLPRLYNSFSLPVTSFAFSHSGQRGTRVGWWCVATGGQRRGYEAAWPGWTGGVHMLLTWALAGVCGFCGFCQPFWKAGCHSNLRMRVRRLSRGLVWEFIVL